MPSTRRMILGHVLSGVCTKMNRTKQLPNDLMETPLNRCLSTFDITLLGIGHMVGAGIYVLTGTVARDIAGPSIVISFLLAAFVSTLAALCYAEFGTRVPKAGSAYIYTYVSIGEFWAFVIGWNILLEHMLGAASVARAWSGYVDSLFGGHIANATIAVTGEMHQHLLGQYPDVLAALVCIAYAIATGTGVRTTAIINGVLTMVNVGVVLLVISLGFWYANPKNWTQAPGGFMPYGIGGVVAGAATCFYAFVGFDSIATSGEEARTPSTSIPLATVLSLGIVTIAYVLVSAALTLMVPYTEINPVAALSDAFAGLGLPWVQAAISVGALCGMTTTLLGSLYALPRCMYAMTADGLLFSCFGRVDARSQVPTFNVVVAGGCSALLALLFDLEKLVEFMSIGTLLAYTIVSASVIVLRYRPPTVEEAVTLDAAAAAAAATVASGGSAAGPGADETTDDDFSSRTNSLRSASISSDQIDIALAGKLRPQYRWLEPLVGRCRPGSAVSGAVVLYAIVCVLVCLQFELGWMDLYRGDWMALVSYGGFVFMLVACVIVMAAHYQNTRNMAFKVPLVPFVPALSIFCNIELMVHLSALTWIRFFIWMVLGMLIYFCYGIHHSREATLGTSYSMLLDAGGAGGSGGAVGTGADGPRGSSGSCDSLGSAAGWGPSTKSALGRIFERSADGPRRNRAEDKRAIIIDEADDS